MAVDRSRLAAALAYKQAEEQRRRQLLESVPLPADAMPASTPRQTDFGTNLENLSIGLGRGLQGQLEGIKGIVTDPVGSAKSVYEAGKAVVRDPAIIAQMLREMGQKATSGPLGAGEVIGEMIGPRKTGPVMAELDVYHGTPHRFPATEANPLGEFDASKIGTGEGAQAFGHGIYLAESPSVAKAYQNPNAGSMFLGSRGINVGGKTYSSSGQLRKARDEATDMTEKAMYDILATAQSKGIDGPGKIAKAIKNNPVAWGSWEFGQDVIDAAMKRIRKEASFSSQKGSFYKADLPDEMIDRMLDWDKPLSEQPAAVREAIENRVRHSNSSRRFLSTNPTGEQLYDMLSDKGDHRNPIEAAEAFKEAGIPGIKFQDAGSRGQGGSGTRNFVVFPGEEKKVRILERDGQKAPPQKIAQALEAAPRKPETAFDAPEVKPGDIVDGLKVKPEVANVGSIKASLDNYTVLPGIRSVSIADFGEAGPLTGNVDKLDRRTRNLADQITESKEITPLIVVYSGTQNYILEGSHRIDALDALGKKRIPVIAVIDEDDPPKFMRQKR